jgi:hypothetical protein
MENNTYLWTNGSTANIKPKQCFCIGPDNCNDNNCELVKKHKEKIGEFNGKQSV